MAKPGDLRLNLDELASRKVGPIAAPAIQLEKLSACIESLVREIAGSNSDQEKRFEKQVKASVNALDLTARHLKEANDNGLKAVTDQLAEIAKSSPALIELLVESLQNKLVIPVEQKRTEFDITRDANGFLKKVIATPVGGSQGDESY
jgi:hypothetical protein|tara:strand:+ start:57 stop:500 length:444 start_codon:yes stop_codon:yes gene_type:complete